ncbi:hypothetical protein Asp14428_46740 [Actinoplanes sp. NBRC 14428]|nr:hypothetical protein Asp14428_46740 [Actinoplanes sp. NBRC 14428]
MSDDTGEYFPFREDSSGGDERHPNGRPRTGDDEPDATRRMPATPAGSDRTEMLPADRTEMLPAAGSDRTELVSPVDDATRVTGRADPTAVQPPVRPTDNWADDDQVWAGRAGVRPPRPGDDATRTDWAAVPADEPRGRWWTPIVVGIVALLLLGVLSWGVYLILQSTSGEDDETPAPVATTSAAPAPTTQPTTKAPTTAPTTTAPSSAPVSSPTDVAIPALRGLSLDEARAALNRKGLNYRLRYVASTEAPPGTVIGSDPSEGQQVPGDTIVNLIIAAEPTTTAPTPTTPAPTSGGADED